ncbi:MAG: hypothetical protein ACJAQZ_004351 [Planctomycetota bacterium]|jgi:hypothetical protein
MQQGEGIRVTSTAVSGGSITVNVGTADDQVEVGVVGSNDSTSYNVSANKDTPIPVPALPPGSTIVVRVGKGERRRRFLITIVAPPP